jgi:hypothetical protein
MRPVGNVTVRYIHRCEECGIEHVQEYWITRWCQIPEPSPPLGWDLVRDKLFCWKHRLEVRIDNGEPIIREGEKE